jgi:hypothetical protein
MAKKFHIDVEIIEQGDIYFFYKPRRGIDETKNIRDVSRFFFVLDPENRELPRYVVMGNKRMPAVSRTPHDGGGTTWGFVQIVGGRGFQTTLQQTRRPTKDASRPAGEGIYAIVKHRGHTHLMYSLELPRSLGEVQRAFNIQQEGNYIFLTRAIEDSPKSPDLPFSNFSQAQVDKLNQRGTEVLLIDRGSDIGRMGIRAETEQETIDTADIFSKLHVNAQRHPLDALISGAWI